MSKTPTHAQNLTADAQRVHDAQAAVERIEQALAEEIDNLATENSERTEGEHA